MLASRLSAAIKALDDMDKFLDDRDYEDAKKMKESGAAPNKGSEAAIDDDNGGLGDKSAPDEDDADHEDTQDAEDKGQSDDGESDDMDENSEGEDQDGDDFMEELERMASGNPSASNAHKMLLEADEDEDTHSKDLRKKKDDEE